MSTTLSAPEAAPEGTPVAPSDPPRSWLRDVPFLILVAVALALIIKAFFVQAFYIPSGSMENTLHIGDRVLVNKLLYDVRGIHRGEIVVFDGKHTDFPPESNTGPASNGLIAGMRDLQRFLGLGAPGESDFIKRVIGLPGDVVQCCTNGHVTVNGRVLNEPYVFEDDRMAFCAPGPDSLDQTAPATQDQCDADAKPFVVPPHRLFVLGDHRAQSADSRYHGTIPESAVIGRAFVRVYPVTRWGLLRVPATFTSKAATAAPPGFAFIGAGSLAWLRRRWISRRRRRAVSSNTRIRTGKHKVGK